MSTTLMYERIRDAILTGIMIPRGLKCFNLESPLGGATHSTRFLGQRVNVVVGGTAADDLDVWPVISRSCGLTCSPPVQSTGAAVAAIGDPARRPHPNEGIAHGAIIADYYFFRLLRPPVWARAQAGQ
jgi:hypothetical protein